MKADIFNLTKITYILVFGASISNLAAGLLEPTVAPYLEILGSSSQEIGTKRHQSFTNPESILV